MGKKILGVSIVVVPLSSKMRLRITVVNETESIVASSPKSVAAAEMFSHFGLSPNHPPVRAQIPSPSPLVWWAAVILLFVLGR